jgi:hypothetical protein
LCGRIKLWSYSDLMSLRTIAWLRATKTAPDDQDVPETAMRAVCRALTELAELDLDLWSEDGGPSVAVDRWEIVLDPATPPAARRWERLLDEDQFELLRPFEITGSCAGLIWSLSGRDFGSCRQAAGRPTCASHADRDRGAGGPSPAGA